jgi:hypothetical protein
MHTELWLESQNKRNHYGDLDAGRRTVSKLILEK